MNARTVLSGATGAFQICIAFGIGFVKVEPGEWGVGRCCLCECRLKMGCFCLAVLTFRFSAEKHCFVLIAHCSQFCPMDCQGAVWEMKKVWACDMRHGICLIVVAFHLDFSVGSTLVHETC